MAKAKERKISKRVNRTIRAVIGAFFVLLIAFCAISICRNVGKSLKLDVTDQKLYTLSDGTRKILDKLHQPIKAKLYYAKTAALKGPDQIRYFNNYYEFVRALLEEYVVAAEGMIELQVIDPRPFSEDEVQALQYGLTRFSVTEEESFFFGLVLQTQFGVEKVIKFFSPDRQNFVEYDISYLIDTAITRQKKRIGIMSSLPVMGDDVSPYMAEMMRRQRQQPKPPWTFVQQLRRQYEVKTVPTDVNDINDVDILLVIHPKNLPENTLFAIDQFVLKGGRTIVCVDPHCIMDRPDQTAMPMRPPSASSDPNVLLRTWGLEMPQNTFAGDRSIMADPRRITRNPRMDRIIGYLSLTPTGECFNTDQVITAELNQVEVLFSGVLREIADSNQAKSGDEIERTPLLMTTNQGNSWKVTSPYELMMLNPQRLMEKFAPGTEPVPMAYLVTGRFKSSFPECIEIEVESEKDSSDKPKDPNDTPTKTKKRIKGLKQASEDCAVVVFADVDFISDLLAYGDSFFGIGKVIIGDNSALILNTIDKLGGSGDLISIRSRGNFKRPFTVVNEIEEQAKNEERAEVANINAQIAGFQSKLSSIMASAKKEEQEVIGSSIMRNKRDLELQIHQAQRQLRQVKKIRRERIEHLGNMLRNFNMLMTPAGTLIIAIVLGIHRSAKKRHYISHASDA
ncbi:MAG: Gldg family protein [Planctomycetota bacterium]|jgi:ABC-type uncharacterized transport system involved in gliding motility auxiliary subunit